MVNSKAIRSERRANCDISKLSSRLEYNLKRRQMGEIVVRPSVGCIRNQFLQTKITIWKIV